MACSLYHSCVGDFCQLRMLGPKRSLLKHLFLYWLEDHSTRILRFNRIITSPSAETEEHLCVVRQKDKDFPPEADPQAILFHRLFIDNDRAKATGQDVDSHLLLLIPNILLLHCQEHGFLLTLIGDIKPYLPCNYLILI